MRSTFIFPCIMTMVPNSTIFFIFNMYKYIKFFHFDMISAVRLLMASLFFFLKLIISIACSLNDSQNFFMQYLPLYTSCLFSMFLNDNIVDIEKPEGTGSPTFVVVDEFPELYLHPSIFFYQTFKICINNTCCCIKFLVLIKF